MVLLTVYDVLKSVFSSGILDSGFLYLSSYYNGIALGLGLLFYMINFGINIVNTSSELKGQMVSLKELVKTGIPIFMIVSFQFIFGPAAFVIDQLNSVTAMSLKDKSKMDSFVKGIVEEQKRKGFTRDSTIAVDEISTSSTNEKPADDVLNVGASFFSGTLISIVDFLVGIILTVVRVCISVICLYLFKILYILGPFAFAFSIIPTFRSSADTWFASWVGMGFIHTTFNIMESVMVLLVTKDISLTGSDDPIEFSSLSLSLSMIGCYLSVFWLTARYISGTGDNGKVMSNLMQAMSTAAQMKMAGGAKGAASGLGGSTAGNAANTAREGMNDKKSGLEA